MRNFLGAMLTACAITASVLGGATAAAEDTAGPCLFGHVDPNNNDSACKYSDSATWPESEEGPDGEPALTCTRLNENQHVRTRDAHGNRFWLCKKYKDSWGHTYYQWTEVLGM
ncbi:hypothetical protein OHB12_24835 [Nocardia sp. NBC_01730]|uniref:hypothetical protein n=1 Tax=Nocardia sp. NBC_01730 TaxID=2975998 RepID=UPI002E0D981F|nr:hypothetical protein OHB12_24835 [Nocardia sp. NBC_01730]